MRTNRNLKCCPSCQKQFVAGRVDKIFCSDTCRWRFANAERLAALKQYRETQNAKSES